MASAKKKVSRVKKSKKATKRSAKKASKGSKKKSAKSSTRKSAKKASKRSKKGTAKPKRAAKRKSPSKSAAPKTETVRSTSRERVYNLTKELPDHQYFVLANGQPVKHVAELAAILDQLEDEVFNHHIRPDSHDYQNWIQHVFEDLELARKIAGVSEKKKMQLVIYKHLAGHD